MPYHAEGAQPRGRSPTARARSLGGAVAAPTRSWERTASQAASVVCHSQAQSDGAPVEDREGAAVAAPSNSNFLVTRGSEEASVLIAARTDNATGVAVFEADPAADQWVSGLAESATTWEDAKRKKCCRGRICGRSCGRRTAIRGSFWGASLAPSRVRPLRVEAGAERLARGGPL